MKKFFLTAIRWYQKTVSPDHGLFRFRHPYGFCRYTPSCSEYAVGAIQTKGVVRGIGMTFLRVLRCNPLSKGGNDPIVS
ncbi:membrane protein insertion efficiency factor YidD [Candidatus Uhrbacteria bacterium]|nr:membrane protein insertion efficiency factor YidD [Candidatus Uhrbacteria bacterium]